MQHIAVPTHHGTSLVVDTERQALVAETSDHAVAQRIARLLSADEQRTHDQHGRLCVKLLPIDPGDAAREVAAELARAEREAELMDGRR